MFDLITPENLVIWIAVGGAIGWLFEAVFKRGTDSGKSDIALGIFGGVAGGVLLGDFGVPVELWSPRVEQAALAAVGALVLLVAMTLFERLT